MALTDAYVCATRLAQQGSTTMALQDYDSTLRRKAVNKVIHQARSNGDMSVSISRIAAFFMRLILRWTPVSWFANDMIHGDQANIDFVKALDLEVGHARSSTLNY